MKIKLILAIIGIVAAIILLPVLAGFVLMGAVFTDVMSYTATGSETLSPTGTPAGNALVVYDPGMSGTAKSAAATIAEDLRAQGYKVELAGVRSQAAAAAADVSIYDVIVVGGPTYAGNISGSVTEYLNGLSPSADTAVGVFATGSVEPESDELIYMQQFVAGIPEDSPLKIKAALKLVQYDDVDQKSTVFVTALLE